MIVWLWSAPVVPAMTRVHVVADLLRHVGAELVRPVGVRQRRAVEQQLRARGVGRQLSGRAPLRGST